jgi:hypothetical protein
MIKPEWYWMLNLPQDKKDNKIGLKSYMCNVDDKDDFISRDKPTTYNDDDYDY